MVDAHLRSKTIETADIKNLIIGGQTGIDGIRFCLAAVTNGENLADPAFSWFMQYKNKNGQGESVGLTPVYENGLVKLSWVPNKLATQVPGRMQIQLYAAIITGEGEAAVINKQWVSEFAIIYIQENINPDPIVATEPSVIEYYVTLYAAYKNAAEAAAAAALASEQAAGTSEDNAADSAYAAEQAAIAAGDSASSAAQSAGFANTSKNAAAGSASEAAGSAAGALASKQAAATSETNAAGHAAEALASKNAAGVSEGNASDSKLKAQKWAEEEKDVEVEPGKFSAKHWMEKASGVYDNFDARFLGYKDADPAVDNKGNALVQGALYFNSVSKMLRLYNGTAWGDLANSAAGITYSGAGSGLEGTNVQSAIDELNVKKADVLTIQEMQDPGWDGENLVNHETRIVSRESEAVAFENLFNVLTNPLSVKPVLNLDFANRKVLDPRITFARASTGKYYDGKTFEKAEENLNTYSQEFDNDHWVKFAVSVSANTAIAPDGTLTADTITPYATDQIHRIHSEQHKAGEYATISAYVKAKGYNLVGIREDGLSGAGVVFNLTDGSAFAPYNNAGVTVSNIKAEDVFGDKSWWRISCTFYKSGATLGWGAICVISPSYTGGQLFSTWLANGTDGIYLWGHQQESRSFLTAYTPVTSQPITNHIPVLKEAGVDEARFDHDPVTGESLGLLIEGQRTNLLVRSIPSIIANGWQMSGVSKPLGTSIAPDGTNNAIWMGYTGAGAHQWFRTISLASGTIRTISAFFKKTDARYFYIENDPTTAFAWFDLDNGTVAYANGKCTADIIYFGNGWYRCWIVTSEPMTYVQVGFNSTYAEYGGHLLATPGIMSGIAWGVQIEVGAFPTSYIPTSGSQVTRSADDAIMIGENFSSWYRQGVGSLYAEARTSGVTSTHAICDINDNTVNKRFGIMYANPPNHAYVEGYNNGSYQGYIAETIEVSEFNKMIGAYEFNNMGASINGSVETTKPVWVVPTFDRLCIGKIASNQFNLNGHIKKIAYYNRRLSNADLQTLTT